MTDTEIIKVEGQSYRKIAGGRLAPVYVAAEHAARQLAAITDRHTITGLRLADASAPDEPGVVVTFSADEGAKIVVVVKDVLAART